MAMRRGLLAVCLLTAMVVPVAATTYEAALIEAKMNVKTAEGTKYDAEFGRQFGKRYLDTMARCTKDADGKDVAPFDLLVRLAKDGSAEEVIVHPESKVGTCLGREVRTGKFLEPPQPSYWVRVEMTVKR